MGDVNRFGGRRFGCAYAPAYGVRWELGPCLWAGGEAPTGGRQCSSSEPAHRTVSLPCPLLGARVPGATSPPPGVSRPLGVACPRGVRPLPGPGFALWTDSPMPRTNILPRNCLRVKRLPRQVTFASSSNFFASKHLFY